MDLPRLLETAVREQWSVGDVDWSRPPRPMSRADEMTIVQLFTDMAGIERLAGALFREQQKRVKDPTLKAIFAVFVKDELRHSHAAQMLADHYDVHHYRYYRESPGLAAFAPRFVEAVQDLTDDVANAYIVAGELILDIALLRSIDDFVGDETSHAVMKLVNRDESRHIAIDYYMSEYYGSEAYEEDLAARPPRSFAQQVAAARTFAAMLYRAQPFIRQVFLDPMAHLDPKAKRLREAFKRMQLLGMKEERSRRPFTRFLRGVQDAFHDPRIRPVFGGLLGRVAGVGPEFLERMYTASDLDRARRMTYAEMAEEALEAKTLD